MMLAMVGMGLWQEIICIWTRCEKQAISGEIAYSIKDNF
jgi:hypothetical protein